MLKLYKATEELKLAPNQQTEPHLRQVAEGGHDVVEGLGALHNKISDVHGNGIWGQKATSKHAELAVSLTGSVATFSVQTWEERIREAGEGGSPDVLADVGVGKPPEAACRRQSQIVRCNIRRSMGEITAE